jgi:predicted nucleotidyltransferase
MFGKEQILAYLLQNKSHFLQKYHLVKLGVFGSYARGEQQQGSDLDLIVEFKDNTQNLSEIKNELRSEIQATFDIPVDICREKYIKPFFRQKILAEAQYV